MKLPENLTLEMDKRIWVGHIHHRTKRSTGCLSRDAMLCMMFKLGLCVEEKNWHRMRGFGHLAKAIERVKFKDGEPMSELDQTALEFRPAH